MSPKEIKGRWKAGWALDVHTLSSIPNTDGTYNTTRSKIGEAVFQLKYRHNQEPMGFLVQELVTFLQTRLVLPYIDVIIPTPPSQYRDFQLVPEIASRVANSLNKVIDADFLIKTKSTNQLKSIQDVDERQKIITGAFSVSSSERYRNKKILIIDDLYRSGTTLNEITKVLYDQANVNNVYVVTFTYTRSKH